MALGFGGASSYDCNLEADLEEVGTDCTPEAQRVQIQSKVLDKAADAFDKYRKEPPALLGPHTFIPPKLIEDFNWPRKVLGVCHPLQATVRLNMRLLCDPESYEQTLAHEVAHYVQYQILLSQAGRWENLRRGDTAPHGRWWVAVMQHMGYEPEVKGEADLSTAYPKQYAGMTCACGKRHHIGRRKLKNVALRNGWFACRCGKRIEPAEFKGARS